MKHSVAAVIVAGGSGRRFAPGGCNKALLELDGSPLLVRVLVAAAPVLGSCVVVAAPGQSLPALDRVGTRVEVVRDSRPGQGPLAALMDGLRAVSVDASVVVLLSTDLPWLRTEVVRLIAAEALAGRLQDGHDWVVPRVGGHPQVLLSCLSASAISTAESAVSDGSRSLRDLLGRLRVRWLEEEVLRGIDPDLESFRDVDLPGDLPDP